MPPTIKEVEDVFFDAMAQGWAQEVPKLELPMFTGGKIIPFVSGDFQVIDSYVVNPISDKSSGMTVITHCGTPVWVMHYGGEYPKHVVPLLRRALRQAYKERRFYGGRGVLRLQDETSNWVYVNEPKNGATSFGGFEGVEQILDLDKGGTCRGYHWYRGMSLLP